MNIFLNAHFPLHCLHLVDVQAGKASLKGCPANPSEAISAREPGLTNILLISVVPGPFCPLFPQIRGLCGHSTISPH